MGAFLCKREFSFTLENDIYIRYIGPFNTPLLLERRLAFITLKLTTNLCVLLRITLHSTAVFELKMRRGFAPLVFTWQSRYQSYKGMDEMRSGIIKNCPHKIDIGPMYSVDPQKRAAYANSVFYPVERELIFDIDMTDYGDIIPDLKEYSEKAIARYWPLMTVAMTVVDEVCSLDTITIIRASAYIAFTDNRKEFF